MTSGPTVPAFAIPQAAPAMRHVIMAFFKSNLPFLLYSVWPIHNQRDTRNNRALAATRPSEKSKISEGAQRHKPVHEKQPKFINKSDGQNPTKNQ